MKTLISKIYLILILLFAYAFYPNFFLKSISQFSKNFLKRFPIMYLIIMQSIIFGIYLLLGLELFNLNFRMFFENLSLQRQLYNKTDSFSNEKGNFSIKKSLQLQQQLNANNKTRKNHGFGLI